MTYHSFCFSPARIRLLALLALCFLLAPVGLASSFAAITLLTPVDSQTSAPPLLPVPSAPPSGDPIDAMLERLSMTRRDLAPDAVSLLLQSRESDAPPPLTTRLLLRPLDAPYVIGHLAAQDRNWAHSLVRTLISAAGRTPAQVSRGYYGNPLAEADRRLAEAGDPFEASVEALWEAAGRAKDFTAAERDRACAAGATLPFSWRREVARLLMASASAARWQQKALARLAPADRKRVAHFGAEEIRAVLASGEDGNDPRPIIQALDYDYLVAGSLDLAAAIEDFEDFLDSSEGAAPPQNANFQLDTPLGRVVFSGSNEASQHGVPLREKSPSAPHPPVHHLLLIDCGGDDAYGRDMTIGGAEWPVQIVVDLAGDDHYETGSARIPAWGGAIAGYSFLIDRAGDDFYQCLFPSQGGGLFGVGVLADRAGDDHYIGLGLAQGAGYAGVGLLDDCTGDDHYEALTLSQGAGSCLGSGTLIDRAGNDTYSLVDEPLLFPSPQAPRHNSSMGQGMGTGLRADLSDGHSVGGGIGVLHDCAGDDAYTASVFAQGCGFLGGTGVLADDAGTDTRRAVYYAQGASAHRAVGILIDRGAGNDTYITESQCALGCGHDFGLGWLLDEAGNDRYEAKRLALGASNENGWGFFVDLAGDDSYKITTDGNNADSFGGGRLNKWGTMREDMPALGFFLDAGGADQYEGLPSAKDNATWLYPRRYPDLDLRSERGVGCDGEYARVDLRTGPLTPFSKADLDEYADQQRLRRKYRETVKPKPTPSAEATPTPQK